MMNSSFRYDYVELTPSAQIGFHSHPEWELSYVVTGRGRRRIGSSEADFGPGELVAVAPNVGHCWEFDPLSVDAEGNIVNITVVFDRSFLERMASFPELREGARRFLDAEGAMTFGPEAAAAIARCLTAMRSSTPAGRLASMAEILGIIGTADALRVGEAVRADDDLQRLRVYLECNFMRAVSLREAADYFGCGKTTFCSILRRRYNTTFTELLNAMRISHARSLLADSAMPVAQIAYAVGFTDAAYFNRVFRRLTGLTPTAFRRSR